jgi:subtilisin family serine protease
VQFTDKNDSPYSLSNPEEYLSQRAIDRRLAYDIAFDMKDIPVNPQYIEGVRNAGATILNPTKWLNGVTIQASDPAVIAAIELLPYVESIRSPQVKKNSNKLEKSFFNNEAYGTAPSAAALLKSVSDFDYGPSLNQIAMIKGDQLHDMGYRGKGMVIGVLDSGFDNADELAVFDSIRDNGQLLGGYDFVAGGPLTFDKHYHGTMVLSTMAGNVPGDLIGTAPEASYYLFRTEDAGSELIIEEYNWVSGAEYADSVGADVLNTSLGYSLFDDPSHDHTYEDMDGNTTPITIGADIAASRGMVVSISAGNSGGAAWFYITAPADGDSVFTIGAVNGEGIPANFSSNGPTYDDRVKPDISTQGQGTYFANTTGNFTYGNGTSFSSPIAAGMMACLWQANPDMSNMELMNAVRMSASKSGDPDNKMGYGIPDFIAANNYLGVLELENPEYFSDSRIFPNPFTETFGIRFDSRISGSVNISVVDLTGRTIYERQEWITNGVNELRLENLGSLPSGMYFFRMENGDALMTAKLVKN